MITKNVVLKRLVYSFLGRLKLRTSKLDDLLILTSSRSGSTWLNESLQNTKEFKIYNQPFDRVFNVSAYDKLLPSDKNNPFYSNLSDEEYKKLICYWKYIIIGKINPNTDWRFYKKGFNFRYKRKLIKTFFTKDFIEFYVSQPNLKIIYLMRNPVHRAISNIHYGYKDFGNNLLKNQILRQSNSINTEKLSNIYAATNSQITMHVISWYLENFIIYSYLNTNKMEHVLMLKYEDMIINKKMESIISYFIFDDNRFTLSQKPSKATQSGGKKNLNLKFKQDEMDAVKSCLPDFLPYLNDLNL